MAIDSVSKRALVLRGYRGTTWVVGDTPVSMDAGSFTHTGLDFTATVASLFLMDTGNYTFSGKDITIPINTLVNMAAGSYTRSFPQAVPAGPLALIAGAPVMSSVPNFNRQEHGMRNTPVQNTRLSEPMDIANGVIRLNGKPGLGYEMNEDELLARAV